MHPFVNHLLQIYKQKLGILRNFNSRQLELIEQILHEPSLAYTDEDRKAIPNLVAALERLEGLNLYLRSSGADIANLEPEIAAKWREMMELVNEEHEILVDFLNPAVKGILGRKDWNQWLENLEHMNNFIVVLKEDIRLFNVLIKEIVRKGHLIELRQRSEQIAAERIARQSASPQDFAVLAKQNYLLLLEGHQSHIPFIYLRINPQLSYSSGVRGPDFHFDEKDYVWESFIAFTLRSDEKEFGLLYPNPKIVYTDSMNVVFNTVRRENAEHVKKGLNPIPIKKIEDRLWQIVDKETASNINQLANQVRIFAYGGTQYAMRQQIGSWPNIPLGALQDFYGFEGSNINFGVGELEGKKFIILRQHQNIQDRGGVAYTMLFDPGEAIWIRAKWNAALIVQNILNNRELRYLMLEKPEEIIIADLISKLLQTNCVVFPSSDIKVQRLFAQAEHAASIIVIGPDDMEKPTPESFDQNLAALQESLRKNVTWLIGGGQAHGRAFGSRIVWDPNAGIKEAARGIVQTPPTKPSSEAIFTELERIGFRILREIEPRGRRHNLAYFSNLREELQKAGVKVEPLSEDYKPREIPHDIWRLVVLTNDGKNGVVLPAIDSPVGAYNETFTFFESIGSRQFDGTQALMPYNIKSFPHTRYDEETRKWMCIKKGVIDLEARHPTQPAPTPSPASPSPPSQHLPTPKPTGEQVGIINDIIQLYNSVDFDTLRKKYKPVRFGVMNAIQLVRGLSTTPIFDENEGGSLYILKTSNEMGYVVPRRDLIITSAEIDAGGLTDAFELRNYEKNFRYRAFKLISPALFVKIGDRWVVSRKGVLELGTEEPEV